MAFAPTRLTDYLLKHLNSSLATRRPKWWSNSTLRWKSMGHMCFTCITGEADPDPDLDYEIDNACDAAKAP